MKIDKLTSFDFVDDKVNNLSYTTSRGNLNGLLITFNSNTVGHLDAIRLSVKLRHKKGVNVLISRLKLTELAVISQIKGGFFGTMGAAGTLSHLITALETATTISAASATGLRRRLGTVDSSFFVDLGHITLGNTEMEITLESDNYGGSGDSYLCEVYSYHQRAFPDMYRMYDESYDYEQGHSFVRDVFAVKDVFIDSGALQDGLETLDVDFQIDGDRSYLLDLNAAIAATNLFTGLEDSGVSYIAQLFSETDVLPAELTLKATGADKTSIKFILIKEVLVQQNVSTSTVTNLESLTKKVEKLEREFPDMAKAYRHAGLIEKSKDLKDVKEAVVESNAEDMKEAE
jgi:hypothetical protein